MHNGTQEIRLIQFFIANSTATVTATSNQHSKYVCNGTYWDFCRREWRSHHFSNYSYAAHLHQHKSFVLIIGANIKHTLLVHIHFDGAKWRDDDDTFRSYGKISDGENSVPRKIDWKRYFSFTRANEIYDAFYLNDISHFSVECLMAVKIKFFYSFLLRSMAGCVK